jgi:hypothetical protein
MSLGLSMVMATWVSALAAQSTVPTLLLRRPVDGERLNYVMNGRNNGQRYQVAIDGSVRKGTDGRLFDEFRFTELTVNGAPHAMSLDSQAFRVAITLGGHGCWSRPPRCQARAAGGTQDSVVG